jgi:hypothetical protein
MKRVSMIGVSTMRRSMMIFLLALITVVAVGQPLARAQQASDWSEWTGVPGPEECVTDAVETDAFIQEIIAAAATPVAEDVPFTVASIDDLPAGVAPSDEEAEGALTTIRELAACVNAGKFGSALAQFTPKALASLLFGVAGMDVATMDEKEIAATVALIAAFLESPVTALAADQQAEIVDIQDVRKLKDGRVLVVLSGSAIDTEATGYVILRKVGNRWLVDAAGSIGELDLPM